MTIEFNNRYAPPATPLSDSPSEVQRFYTPRQIGVAALLGGALAAGFFVARNYTNFGSESKARVALIVSIIVLLGLVGWGVAAPHDDRSEIGATNIPDLLLVRVHCL